MERRAVHVCTLIVVLLAVPVTTGSAEEPSAAVGGGIAPHHVGDNVTIVWDDGDSEWFQWIGPVLIRDAASRLVEAQAVYWSAWDGWTYHRGDDMHEIASDLVHSWERSSTTMVGPVALDQDYGTSIAFFRWSQGMPSCLLHVAAWQGGCHLKDPDGIDHWNANYTQDGLLLSAEGAWRHELFVPDGSAYPARYLITDGNETRQATITVDRGDGPVVQPSTAVHEAAPVLNHSALQPWGPVDTGAQVDSRTSRWNWPASEAFRDAEGDLEGALADHLARFPDSQAVRSVFEEHVIEDDVHLLTWRFTMSGSPGLEVVVNRTVAAQTLSPRASVHTAHLEAIPHPARLDAPHIADLQRIWALHSNQSAPGPLAWGHSVHGDTVTVFLGGSALSQGLTGDMDSSLQVIVWTNGTLAYGFGVDFSYAGARLRIVPPVLFGEGGEGGEPGPTQDNSTATADADPDMPAVAPAARLAPQGEGAAPAGAPVPDAVVGAAVVAGAAAGAAAAGWSLKWLLGALFSRVTGPSVAHHAVRRRILDTVEAEPGIHLRRLGERLQIGNGALRYHVRRLRDAGLIVQQTVQGRQALSLPSQRDVAREGALMHGRTGHVMRLIRERPGLLVKEMHEHSGIPMSTLHHHLRTLRESGLVSAQAGRYRPA